MERNDKMPVIVCDDWTIRSYKRFKVERKYNRYQQLIDILQSLDDRLKKIEEDKSE